MVPNVSPRYFSSHLSFQVMKTFGILAANKYYNQKFPTHYVEKAAPFLFVGKGSFAFKLSHNSLAVATTGFKIYFFNLLNFCYSTVKI